MFKIISRFRLVGILVLLLTTLATCSSPSTASQMSVTPPSSMTLPVSATSFPTVMPQAFTTPSSSVISQASSMTAPATETRVTIEQTDVRTAKIIIVSLSQQELDAYDNGQLFVSTPIATGRPQLPTLTGTYHIFAKYSPYRFISPWPVGSPYYYAPVTANYAMEWAAGGYFIHNAPWRGYFGKGANNWHSDSLMGEDPGTHGCIDVPTGPMNQLYSWADIGTTVRVDL